MKKFILLICIIFLSQSVSNAVIMQGGIYENSRIDNSCIVIDKVTKQPIPNARISIPSKNYTVYSDKNGHFLINTGITGQTILSTEKEGYKSFTKTLNKNAHLYKIVIELEKNSAYTVKLENNLCHLGDDNYSVLSANAGDFKIQSVGPIYTKNVYIPMKAGNAPTYLIFGSIIGIDTALARGMGQNKITTSYASPPIVYLNGKKIAQIQINGDNQKIKLPNELIKWNSNNIVTIKAGVNLMQTAYVDYDDFEFMNLSIE